MLCPKLPMGRMPRLVALGRVVCAVSNRPARRYDDVTEARGRSQMVQANGGKGALSRDA
jgi:hypothetical protein